MNPPIEAFGLCGNAVELPGGVTGVLRFGDVVIKPVADLREAEWTQATFSSLRFRPYVRWARPIAARDGRWVADGWIANEFVPDLTPVAPDWAAVVELGARFRAATADIDAPHAMLRARTHRWARGERHAFDEETQTLPPDTAELDRRLAASCVPDAGPEQLVHVDLTNNVFLDPEGVPVILDIAPGWRSPAYASAVVVADALVWSGASLDIVEALGGLRRARPQVARALRFRLVTDHLARQAASMDEASHLAALDLARYRQILSALS